MARFQRALVCLSLPLVVTSVDQTCSPDDSTCAARTSDEADLTSALQLTKKKPAVPDMPPRKCVLLPQGQPVREPLVVTSPVILRAVDMLVCDPANPEIQFYTRAYALPGQEPTIPGPTIRVNPGEWLNVTIVNELGKLNPSCSGDQVNRSGQEGFVGRVVYCYVNTTNLHTHGLHVTPKGVGDSIFRFFEPGQSRTLRVKLPDNHHTGTNWYHPHSHHSTAAQSGGGLLGALMVPDPDGLTPERIRCLESKVLALTMIDMMGTDTSRTRATSPIIENWSGGELFKNTKTNELVTIPNGTAVLVNGMFMPTLILEDGQWMRLNMIYAAIEFNVIMDWFETQWYNGLRCEFQMLAKDGVYLSTAPRRVGKIYMASGNRVDLAIRCSCKQGWKGGCTGVLKSQRDFRAQENFNGTSKRGKAFKFGFWGPPEPSTDGPFAGCTENTIQQVVMNLEVRPSGKWPAPPLPKFSVRRPCYLANLLKQKPLPENQGVISIPQTGPPTDPPWQVVYWSNVSTPKKYIGEPFEHSPGSNFTSPPLRNWSMGTMQELLFAGAPKGGYPEDFNRAFQIAGLASHPLHLHVTPYQIIALRCPDFRWIWRGSCFYDNDFYKVGDWHDNILQAGGAALVRFQVVDFNGPYVFHCHILSHEDQGMMAYFDAQGKEGTKWPGARKAEPTCYEGFFEPLR